MSQNVSIPAFGGQGSVGAIPTTYPFAKNVDVVEGPSAAAAAIATSGTITTLGVSIARIAPAAAVTGIIMQPGAFAGQSCWVINEAAAAYSATFAAASTSNVAGGTGTVIAGNAASSFIWDVALSLWVKAS